MFEFDENNFSCHKELFHELKSTRKVKVFANFLFTYYFMLKNLY